MSGVEEVLKDPPDKTEDEVETVNESKVEEIGSGECETKPATDSEASSLTGSWTLLEKEEEVVANKPESESSSDGGSSIEVLDKKDGQKTEESDSDSIETISDDEILVAQSHANLASYCVPDLDGATHESLTSTISTVSVASDGIPIKSEDGGDDDDNVGDQYVWNNEGERELPEERVQEIQQPDIDEEEEEENEDERRLEPGEPGYDLDDDGLPGEPLPPLPQEVELYPSQELDPNFQIIKTEKIYKHDKNLQVDHFLTAILVLALALVIGLGIGHFLGIFFSVTSSIDPSVFGVIPDEFEENVGDLKSEGKVEESFSDRLEFADNSISKKENQHSALWGILGIFKSAFTRLGVKFGYLKKPQPHPDVLHDFQDGEEYFEFQCMNADDLPIMVENRPVTVSQPEDCSKYFTTGQPAGHATLMSPPEAFTDVARKVFKSDDQDLDDRVIKQLWEENQDLRDQVHQMKSDYPQADEAMTAILRDRINDLLTANADLEREVVRLRYADAARGAAESVETLKRLRNTRDTLNDIVTENDQLKIEVGKARYGEPKVDTNYKEERDQLAIENKNLKEQIKILMEANNPASSLFNQIDKKFIQPIVTPILNRIQKEEFTSPWPSKRNEELKTAKDDETINDTENKEENSMTTIHQYLTKLLKVGGEALSKDGKTKWVQSEKLMMGLKDDLLKTFNDKFGINEDVTAILGKFNDLKTFITPNSVPKNLKTFQVASEKFLKSLLGAVDDLREANEDAAETSNWSDSFNYEAAKIKKALEQKWTKIYNKMQELNMNKDRDDDDHDDDDKKQRPNDNMKKSKQNKKKWNGRDDDDDEDEGYKSHDEGNDDTSFKSHKNRGNHKYKERHDDDDDDNDDDDKSYKSYKNRGNHKYKERHDDGDDDDDDNDIKRENRQDKEFRRRENSEDYKSSENKRKHKSKERNTTNWEQKRSNGREKRRTENDRSDWIFERAKQRKDLRYEETRADWYFERKKLRDGNKCLSDDCNSKPKGEKFVKEPHNYVKNHINERKFSKDQEKFKEEKKQKYDEKTKYAEKHFSDNKNKNFKKKPKIH